MNVMHCGKLRIAVVGTTCSGKTTLAKGIATAIGLPHIELDVIYWLPDWKARPTDEFRMLVSSALEGDCWIVDGNYSAVRDIVWGRATTLIWLNFSFPIIFARALRRTVRRIVFREVLFAGNTETFRSAFLNMDGIPYWVLRTYWKIRKSYPRLFKENRFSHLQIIELKDQNAAHELLAKYWRSR